MSRQVQEESRGCSARYCSINHTENKRRTSPGDTAAGTAVQQKPDADSSYRHTRDKADPAVAEQIVHQQPHQDGQGAVDCQNGDFSEAKR